MKKVRFETPTKIWNHNNMNERECHSPRPLMERQVNAKEPDVYSYTSILPYSNDPVQLFECSNTSPYPMINKTRLQAQGTCLQLPSTDLELSMLDSAYHEPRRPVFSKSAIKSIEIPNVPNVQAISHKDALSLILNKPVNALNPPNVLVRDNAFFLRRENLNKLNLDTNPIQKRFADLSIDKENNPLLRKAEIINMAQIKVPENKNVITDPPIIPDRDCNCHHCKTIPAPDLSQLSIDENVQQGVAKCGANVLITRAQGGCHCPCGVPPTPPPPPSICTCCNNPKQGLKNCVIKQINNTPVMNAVDKKTWAIQKYERSKEATSMEVEKQNNIVKEKREPTVSDLFKIIKLQNEQLQLLQEKVDKFISASQQQPNIHVQNIPEQPAIEAEDRNQHKISIGVMTSFEVVRTSTIINKELVKTCDNAQIQCNRSEISIKEVLSRTQSPHLNVLDGISPISNNMQVTSQDYRNVMMKTNQNVVSNEEKTLNEMSLYNVQIDNATTPNMSPEQSLYLDVRDYSESEDSDEQSNVGWTYYNKVMTHVNGVLQDSDMPSSASALYRNTRQHMETVQMQIDKTNVSVTKRVKFGDDPLGLHQPHLYGASTDTSLKMNQLAAKYLNAGPAVAVPQRPAKSTLPSDMSYATRNYMERHKILQGTQSSKSPVQNEIPKFLDITALKQQPKFL